MYYKSVLLIFLAVSICFGDGFNVSKIDRYHNFSKEIKIFLDSKEEFSIQNIVFEDFIAPKSSALGYVKGVVWTKLELLSTDKKQLLLVNPKVNINIIDVYVMKNGNLIATYNLGNSTHTKNGKINSKFSNFMFEMEANSNYTIISKIKSKSPIDVTWIATNSDDFLYFMMLDILFWGIFVGVIISLIIYNLSIFKNFKEYSYVVYAFHGFFTFVFQFATNGNFYQFGLYTNTSVFNSVSWASAQLSLISILFFAMLFLNTKKSMPAIHRLILMLISAAFVMLLLFLYSFINTEIINVVRSITKPLSIGIVIFVFIIIFIGVKNKTVGGIYYLIGHGFFLSTLIFQQIGGIINQEMSFLNIYIVAIGIIFEIVLLSLALSEKFLKLQYEKNRNEKIIIAQAGFTNIGKTLSSIYHQYKTPLTHINAQMLSLETYLFKTNNQDTLLQNISKNMRESISFMDTTMNNFNDFYKNSTYKEEFNIKDEILFIKNMLMDKINLLKVDMQVFAPTINYIGYKNAFDNVIMVIIENAIDIFQSRQIKNPTISIFLKHNSEFLTIEIIDNGGGIVIEPIESIFDIFVSSKDKSSGLGLAICKMLVETKLKGDIKVYNIDAGSCFEIRLYLKNVV